MKGYIFTYIRTGSGETKKLDKVTIWEKDSFEFEDETITTTDLNDCMNAFEKIAARWWGTFETKNAITNIEIINV